MKSTPCSKPWYNPDMKTKTFLLILGIILVLILVSCKTVEIIQEPVEITEIQPEAQEEQPEEIPAQEPAPEEEPEQEEEPIVEPAWTVGETGPYGNLIIECEGLFLEISEPLYEAESYDAALKYCKELSTEEVAYRLPTVAELASIYSQILEPELAELDYTYYWSCEENEDGTVRIMNFDTGFEGSFYRDMDFVSAIAVTEL